MAEISEKEFQYILPTEIWSKVISFLPRVSRLELAQIQGFYDLVQRKKINFQNLTYRSELS